MKWWRHEPFVVIQNREVAENFVNVHRMYTKFFVTLLL